jgi:hypothetical protein
MQTMLDSSNCGLHRTWIEPIVFKYVGIEQLAVLLTRHAERNKRALMVHPLTRTSSRHFVSAKRFVSIIDEPDGSVTKVSLQFT